MRITENKTEIPLEQVMSLLKQTYWADKRSEELVRKSMEHSSCYGVLTEENKLVGFARVISDYATSYYLCDVVIDEAFRGQGLGKLLVSHIESAPEYAGLRGMLITKDAHGLYEKYGYSTLDGRFMVKTLNC